MLFRSELLSREVILEVASKASRLLRNSWIGVLSVMLTSNSAFGQSDPVAEDTTVYLVAETMPEYPGGNNKFFELINKNLNLSCIPDSMKIISSKIWCDFIVDKNGFSTDIDAHYNKLYNECLTKEFERIFALGGKWKPGEMKGKMVNVRMKVPVIIHFR